MATVTATLKLIDQFSGPLGKAASVAFKAIQVIDRLRRSSKRSVKIRVSADVNGALKQLEQLRKMLNAVPKHVRIIVSISMQTVKSQLEALRVSHAPLLMRVRLHTREATSQARELRTDLLRRLGRLNIQFRVSINMGMLMGQIRAISAARFPLVLMVVLNRRTAIMQAMLLRIAILRRIGLLRVEVRPYLNMALLLSQLRSIRAARIPLMMRVILNTRMALLQAVLLRSLILHRIGRLTVQIWPVLNMAVLLSQLRNLRAVRIPLVMRVVLDTRWALLQAVLLRMRILQRIGRLRVEIILNSSLYGMISGLTRLVERLAALIRSIGAAAEQVNPGGSAGDSSKEEGSEKSKDKKKKSLTDMVKGNFGFASKAGKKIMDMTTSGAMEQQRLEDLFVARTGDEQVGKGMFQKYKAEALSQGADVDKYLKDTLSMFSLTRNTDKLSKLGNLSQRMNMFDNSGSGNAADLIRTGMEGDSSGLAKQFGFNQADMKDAGLDKFAKAGDLDGYTKALEGLMEKYNMGQSAADSLLASPIKQIETLNNTIKSSLADAGQSALAALMPLVMLINTAFQEGKLQPFFDVFRNGMMLAGEIAASVGQLIFDNLDIVKNILIAVGLTALIVGGYFLFAWLSAVWPILLIIGVIALIIEALNYFGVSTQEIIGFVAGLFMGLVAVIWNLIASVWNLFVDFAEFLLNLFVDPIYSIKKLFYDLAMAFGGQVYNMLRSAEDFAGGFMKVILQGINAVLKGFNWLSARLKDLFNIDMGEAKLLDEENVNAVSDSVKNMLNTLEEPTSSKDLFDLDDAKMNLMDPSEKFKSGYKAGSDLFNGKPASPGIDEKKWNQQSDLTRAHPAAAAAGASPGNIDRVGRVGEVGKINDTVDISSEDLKTMRELAEMKNIQNFVSLTPTIQVSGDNHFSQSVDMEGFVAQLANAMETEISSSAKGAW
ncbi:hypothetical protein EBB07_01385 [Paenibacillaceae bacterium]|nr:hypothetical protein EBB07_01385 [Paenibacillaceae bacterium]